MSDVRRLQVQSITEDTGAKHDKLEMGFKGAQGQLEHEADNKSIIKGIFK